MRVRFAGIALGCGLLGPLAAQAQTQELFRVDLGRDPPRVAADHNGVAVDSALRELANAMRWRIDFETRQLESSLAVSALDLAFEGIDARTAAHLIAVAGGCDVTFDDREIEGSLTTILHIVRSATPESDSGRDRLRRFSIAWYQAFLAEDMKLEPLVQKEGIPARMNLGLVLMKQGDLQSAARAFESVWKLDQSHPFVPKALLRLAECLHEMGQDEQSETWARELKKRNPALEETADATVLLGKVLIALGKKESMRFDECVRTLEAMLLPLADAPQVVDVLLLIGEAQRLRGEPKQVLRAMELLWSAHDWRKFGERQMLDYWFLRGAGAEGVGKPDEAMEALEWFLGLTDSDPRRGLAFVMLGRSYLALGRFVEARAAALEAKTLAFGLDADGKQQMRFLEANSGLALGDRDRALEELEVEVRRAPAQVPEQVLFLVDKLMEVGRYQKAVQAADLLDGVKGKHSDQARIKKAQALFRQAEGAGGMKGFPAQAIEIARKIEDAETKRPISELVGKAYEMLGDVDRAADAYRGILR